MVGVVAGDNHCHDYPGSDNARFVLFVNYSGDFEVLCLVSRPHLSWPREEAFAFEVVVEDVSANFQS